MNTILKKSNVLCFDSLQQITDSELDARSNLYNKGQNYNNNTISTFKTHSYKLLHSLNRGLYMVEIICWKKWEKSLMLSCRWGDTMIVHHCVSSSAVSICELISVYFECRYNPGGIALMIILPFFNESRLTLMLA